MTQKISLPWTKALLMCGIVVGPIYVLTAVLQMFIREGFDPSRHDWSLLSNGDLGWIQIANFVISGLLTIAFALGIKKVLTGRGRVWGPLLIGLYGIGLIAAGIFVADPMNGFPVDAAATTTLSTNALLHMVSGSIGFIGLIAACFVFARRFRSLKDQQWSLFSSVTGILFFASFVGVASGSQPGSPLLVPVTLAFTAAVLLAWTWMSLLAIKLLKAETK